MKKTVLLALCTLCTTVFSQEITIDRDLTNWKRIGKNVASDSSVTGTGKYSLRVGSDSQATRTLKLEMQSHYTITFNIRGKEIQSTMLKSGKKSAAYLILRGGKRANLLGGFENGTFDWKTKKVEFSPSQLGTNEVTLAVVMRGKGTVWVDDVKFTKTVPEYFQTAYSGDIKEIALLPGGVFGFYDPGQTVKFKLITRPVFQDLKFTFKVRNDLGKVVYEHGLKPVSGEFTVPGQEPGYYVAECELYRKGKKIYRIQSAFAVNRSITRRDPFFAIGFGAHAEALEGFKRIGVGSINLKVKTSIPGRAITPQGMLDLNMNRWGHRKYIESDAFTLSAVFSGAAVQKHHPSREKVKAGFPVTTDAYWDHYAKVVELYITQNKGKIRNYVIQSEIPSQAGHKERNCGTFTEAMFNHMVSTRIASRIIRRIDPAAVIWFGGNNRMEYQNTTERIVAEDLVKEIDGLVIDAYSGNWYLRPGAGYRMPEEKMLDFIKTASDMSVRLGLPQGKAIRNEELGYAMNYGEPYDGKYAHILASVLARSLILNKASNAIMMEIHVPYVANSTVQLRKNKNEDRYMAAVWRSCWIDGKGGRTQLVPLPGGAMYATVASELAFVKFSRKVVNGDFYAYIFTKPSGGTVAVLWNLRQDQSFRIKLPVDGKLVNMYGRETSLRAGMNDLALSMRPSYLSLPLDAAETARLIRSALQENMPECISKAYFDSVSSIRVFVRNQTDRVLQADLVFPGMKNKKISVPVLGVASFVLPVKSPGKLVSAGGREYPVELESSSVYTVQKIGKKPVFNGSGDWLKGRKWGLLKYPEHIRPSDALQEERCYFKTPGNPNGHSVSARYWTAYDKENFYLAVEVDDPVHQQRYEKGLLWQDDCLQFSFTADDFLPMEFRPLKDLLLRSQFNYCMALTGKGLQICKLAGRDAGLKKFPAKITRKNGKTLYELAVPFKTFGGKRPVRFGFVVFDNNYRTLARAPYWLEFSPGVTSGKDSSYLKLLNWQ